MKVTKDASTRFLVAKTFNKCNKIKVGLYFYNTEKISLWESGARLHNIYI